MWERKRFSRRTDSWMVERVVIWSRVWSGVGMVRFSFWIWSVSRG